MKSFMLMKISFLLSAVFILSACGLRNRTPEPVVPIAITISADDPDLTTVNFDIYAFRVIDRLEEFSAINLDLTDELDTARVLLNIDIENFNMFPPDQRISRRVFRRNVQVGTDANGRPVYQTVTASADIVSSRIRTSALFRTNLRIKGSPGKNFQRTFNSNLNLDNVYVTNIQGDSRAVDPGLYSLTAPAFEPQVQDILLALSNREMLDRLNREIRSYYDK
ncbi:hypothetical protein [Pedobacter sp. SYSU D00535]|uniref:hypothetical protein n=1 Tax=Pedobacter sp. SYSU D00535 TaxID=2810308 RepID=UPI001A97111C|nr:hypothetical protein [Pedobacter sp. SYSU D00535]